MPDPSKDWDPDPNQINLDFPFKPMNNDKTKWEHIQIGPRAWLGSFDIDLSSSCPGFESVISLRVLNAYELVKGVRVTSKCKYQGLVIIFFNKKSKKLKITKFELNQTILLTF